MAISIKSTSGNAEGVWHVPFRMMKARVDCPENLVLNGEVDQLSAHHIGIAFVDNPGLMAGWAVTASLQHSRQALAFACMVGKRSFSNGRHRVTFNLYGADRERMATLLADPALLDGLQAARVVLGAETVAVAGYVGLHVRHDLTPPLARQRVDLAGLRQADGGGIMILARLMDSGHRLENCPPAIAAMIWVATGRRP